MTLDYWQMVVPSLRLCQMQDLPCKKNQPKLQSTLPRSQNSGEKSEAKTIEIILLTDLNLAQGWQC